MEDVVEADVVVESVGESVVISVVVLVVDVCASSTEVDVDVLEELDVSDDCVELELSDALLAPLVGLDVLSADVELEDAVNAVVVDAEEAAVPPRDDEWGLYVSVECRVSDDEVRTAASPDEEM
jgi:hypothetical protein